MKKLKNLGLLQIISVFVLSFTYIVLFGLFPDLQEVLGAPLIVKISNIALFFTSLFAILRARDYLLETKFDINNIKNSTSLSIYYSVTFFAIAIALSLIIM